MSQRETIAGPILSAAFPSWLMISGMIARSRIPMTRTIRIIDSIVVKVRGILSFLEKKSTIGSIASAATKDAKRIAAILGTKMNDKIRRETKRSGIHPFLSNRNLFSFSFVIMPISPKKTEKSGNFRHKKIKIH